MQAYDAMLSAECAQPYSSSLNWTALDTDVVAEIAGILGPTVRRAPS